MSTEQPYDFLRRVVHKIPGWLQDFTGIMTMDLLAHQTQQNVKGSLLEIGVFQGRYFSILLRSALASNSRLLGVDTFQYVARSVVERHIEDHFPGKSDAVSYLQGRSTDLNSASLSSELGELARFISIDGSHEKNDVYLDLELCDSILSVGGIIAVDDFLNPVAIGVNEAVNLYFRVPRRVVPFSYIANKLFLCRESHAEDYKNILREAAIADQVDLRGAALRAALQNDPQRSERLLFGHKVLMIP